MSNVADSSRKLLDFLRKWGKAFVAYPTLLLAVMAGPAYGQLLVTTSADSGPGSLRQAILDSNSTVDVETIEFSLFAADLVITPLTPLPTLLRPVIIDGTSQPGWAGAPLVELDGSVTGEIGLFVAGGDSTIQGLAIHSFNRGIYIGDSGSNRILGCHIGTDSTGTVALGNTETGIHVTTDTNFIGGSSASDRNVISANDNGILISSQGSSNVVIGNYIGTTADGTSALGNTAGIRVFGNENYIGGTAAGERNVIAANNRGAVLHGVGAVMQGNWVGLGVNQEALGNAETGIRVGGTNNLVGGDDPAERNIVSNNGTGVVITSSGTDNRVLGNYIGTDPGGTTSMGNTQGVRVLGPANRVGGPLSGEGNVISGNERGLSVESDGSIVEGNLIGLNAAGTAVLGNAGTALAIGGPNNQIGGTDPGAANVISGNGSGISIYGENTNDNVIEGNLIGTDPSGMSSRENDGTGIRVIDGTGNRIGGLAPGAGNVIAGGLRGITLESDSSATVVQGNILGLNASATGSLRNRESSIYIKGPNNQIGGTAAGAGNIISGARYYGIFLNGPAAHGNAIEGNEIGTILTSGGRLSNGSAGIRVLNAFDNMIGGTTAGTSNVIAANGNWGVFLETGTGNAVLGNSIFQNGLLGIDHHLYGPNANDPGDVDFGPNLGQNYPVLDSVLSTATETAIEGQLATEPEKSYRIEFFSSPECDPSGFGQGRTFLGATTVFTDAGGLATISVALPLATSDPFVAATATSADGNTSEYSPCALVGGPNPGVLQFALERTVVWEYYGEATVVVTRSHGTAGTVTVDYASFDDTAVSPDDHTNVSGTLTFGPGEVLKTFTVPVHVDTIDDHGDEVALVIENPTGGATLGRASSSVWIGDADWDLPTLFIDDAEVVEGDSGTTHLAFRVRLSPSSVPVSTGYATIDGTAVAGVDYEETTGQLHFAVGETEKTVLVPIYGDVTPEADELLFLRLLSVTGSTVTDGMGEGIVRDDDAAPPPALCVGGTTIAKPKVVLAALGGSHGDERALLTGALEFAPGTPAGLGALDLMQQGAQIRLEDMGTGLVLIDLTTETNAVPAGERDISACDPAGKKKDGWTVSRDGTAHVYRNTTGAFWSAGCAPGSAKGLRRLAIKDKRERHGQIRFSQTTRRASIAPAVGPLRMTIVLGGDASAGSTGACGTHQFAPSDCEWTQGGTRLVCK